MFSDPTSITISYSTGNMQQTTNYPLDITPEKLLDARYELFDEYASITFQNVTKHTISELYLSSNIQSLFGQYESLPPKSQISTV